MRRIEVKVTEIRHTDEGMLVVLKPTGRTPNWDGIESLETPVREQDDRGFFKVGAVYYATIKE